MGHCFPNEHSIVTVPLGEDAVIFSLYYFHSLSENQLTIRVYFWTYFCKINLHVIPYASTTVLVTVAV